MFAKYIRFSLNLNSFSFVVNIIHILSQNIFTKECQLAYQYIKYKETKVKAAEVKIKTFFVEQFMLSGRGHTPAMIKS